MTSIIVATDLSDNALEAARWAFGLASRITSTDEPATVTMVQVVPNDEMELRKTIGNTDEAREKKELSTKIRRWLDDVDTGDVDFDIEVHIGRPTRVLSDLADRRDTDWLVVGKSGKGRIRRLFLGSTAEHLALRPPCPMAVIDPDGFQWDDELRMLSAVDLTESSVDAAALAAEMVRCHRGILRLLHVISLPQGSEPVIEGPDCHPDTLQDHLDDATAWARDELDAMIADRAGSFDDLSPTIDIRPGYPIHEVLDAVDDLDANMLTLGSHGRSRLTQFMLGGIGRSLLRKAPCSVILTPPVARDSQD